MAEEISEGSISRESWRSLWAVLLVQALNAFNDNFTRFLLIGVSAIPVIGLSSGQIETYPNLIGLLLSLPYILLAPVAGWFSDRFSKKTMLMACLWAQVAILALMSLLLFLGQLWWASLCFFLLAIQSAFFNPAKLGILKELVGGRKLGQVSGWMQMATNTAIIGGMLAGGLAFEAEFRRQGGEAGLWMAAAFPMLILFLISGAALWVGRTVRRTEAHEVGAFHGKLFFQHFVHLSRLLGGAPLRRPALGKAFFWFAGSFLTLTLVQVGRETAASPESAGAIGGTLTAFLGIGIAAGGLLAALVCRKRIETGLIPVGGLGMAVAAAVLASLPGDSAAFRWVLVWLGATSSGFLVPLNALVQDRVPAAERGRLLSASSLLDSLASLLGVLGQLALVNLGCSSGWQIGLLAGLIFLATGYTLRILTPDTVRLLAAWIVGLRYRLTLIGEERMPARGGVLVVLNHSSYMDAFLAGTRAPRLLRYVMEKRLYEIPLFTWFLRIFEVVPVSPTRAKEAIRITADAVKEGTVAAIFPEGQLSRLGTLLEFRRGFEMIARRAGSPVQPVLIDGIWGSMWTFGDRLYFKKRPRPLGRRRSVRVVFGEPLSATQATPQRVVQELQSQWAEAFGFREELATERAASTLRKFARRGGREEDWQALLAFAHPAWIVACLVRLQFLGAFSRREPVVTAFGGPSALWKQVLRTAFPIQRGLRVLEPELGSPEARAERCLLADRAGLEALAAGSGDFPEGAFALVLEPVPEGVRSQLEAAGLAVCTGLLSPVSGLPVVVNLPDEPPIDEFARFQTGRLESSLGRCLPGVGFRLHGPSEEPTGSLAVFGLGVGENLEIEVPLERTVRVDEQGLFFPI
ncbi:MAG: MFS transporter [Verrucomicrobiota bacterium]